MVFEYWILKSYLNTSYEILIFQLLGIQIL